MMTRSQAPTPALSRPASPTFEVNDLEQLRVLSDPLRMRILHTLHAQPLTVKQVADRLEMTPTKLYYHVGELERIGVVKVVETRVKSGIIEKYYQLTADIIKVSRDLFKLTHQEDGRSMYAELLASILEATADDIRLAVANGALTPPEEGTPKTANIGHSVVHLSPKAAERFALKLSRLMKEIDAADDAEGEIQFAATAAFFPLTMAPTAARTKRAK